MKNNIKELWGLLYDSRKTQIVESIKSKKEYAVTSSTYIKQEWIWKGNTPLKHQASIFKMIKNSYEEQLKIGNEVLAKYQ